VLVAGIVLVAGTATHIGVCCSKLWDSISILNAD